MKKRFMLLACFAFLTAAMVFGSGQSAGTGQAVQGAPETVTAFAPFTPFPGVSGITSYGDHIAWQVLEKKVNVNIEFQTVPANE